MSGLAGPSLEVIRATSADVDVLSQVIADSFCDLAPSRWLVPDGTERRKIFPGYFRIFVEHALATGIVHTTPARDAAALWLPGDAAPPDDYPARLAAATGSHAARFAGFDTALDARRPAQHEYRHLAILAVAPARQRRGTGTTLLAAYHHRLDQLGRPAYLEAANDQTRQLYARHGYTPYGPPLTLPGGPQMHPMLREPARFLA